VQTQEDCARLTAKGGQGFRIVNLEIGISQFAIGWAFQVGRELCSRPSWTLMPLSVRERIFHLVPIVENIVGANDGKDVGVGEAADALEGINDVLVLELKLLLVVDMLPLAPAADAKVSASRLHAKWRWLFDGNDLRLSEVLLFLQDLDSDHIPWNSPIDKHNEALHPTDTLPLKRCILDIELDLIAALEDPLLTVLHDSSQLTVLSLKLRVFRRSRTRRRSGWEFTAYPDKKRRDSPRRDPSDKITSTHTNRSCIILEQPTSLNLSRPTAAVPPFPPQ
jgi:hypothetical protein